MSAELGVVISSTIFPSDPAKGGVYQNSSLASSRPVTRLIGLLDPQLKLPRLPRFPPQWPHVFSEL